MKYLKKILENGMTIILAPTKMNAIISIGFFVRVGSRDETDENNGIAHFLEHMMFKGTTNRTADDVLHQLDVLGTIYNAVTTMEYTYYYTYGNSNDIKKILDIMLDIYINPDFKTNEIKKEKKVIIEEMRMRNDMPIAKLYTIMHKKIFKGTALERSIIGTEEIINSLSRKDFISFRKKYYRPDNTIFVIVGNFNPTPILKIVENILKPLKNPVNNISYDNDKKIIMENMENQKQPYVYIKKNILYKQTYVILVFPIYDLYKNKRYQIDLLAHLLTSGSTSRLNQSLRENNGITYSSYSYPMIYSDSGVFVIQLIMNPIEFKKGIKILMNELKRIKNELMTQDEMHRIQNFIKTETMSAVSNNSNLLIYYGLNFLQNNNFKPNINEEYDKYKNISRSQVRNIAREIFLYDKINLLIYGNIDIVDFNFLKL